MKFCSTNLYDRWRCLLAYVVCSGAGRQDHLAPEQQTAIMLRVKDRENQQESTG